MTHFFPTRRSSDLAISRTDYALGKFAAMTSAMLMITLVPQLFLFIGNALNTQDVGTYLTEEWDQLFPIVATALLISEEHTSELQSLMRISYAVLCLKKKKKHIIQHTIQYTE